MALKCLDHSKSPDNKLKSFIVTFETESQGNCHVPDILLNHNQEEADTLLLLHALTVDKESEVVIDSPDTDFIYLFI